jgi:hypothetical protein
VRDDALFEAAVVGLGCVGVVGSLVFDLVPAFDLDHRWIPLPFDAALHRFVGTLDGLRLPRSARPYHANLVLNPHRPAEARLSVAWKEPATTPATVARPPGWLPPVGPALACLARAAPPVVGPVLERLIAGAARPPASRGRLGQVFPDRTPAGFRPFSMEIAVPIEAAPDALAIVRAETGRHLPGFRYPGFVAVRWMRGSTAPLAFTRFERTVTIELPSMGGVPGTLALHDRLRDQLDAAGIVWAEHPGQHHDPARLAASFGPRLGGWQAARAALLGEDAWRFASPWSTLVGLTPSAR